MSKAAKDYRGAGGRRIKGEPFLARRKETSSAISSIQENVIVKQPEFSFITRNFAREFCTHVGIESKFFIV